MCLDPQETNKIDPYKKPKLYEIFEVLFGKQGMNTNHRKSEIVNQKLTEEWLLTAYNLLREQLRTISLLLAYRETRKLPAVGYLLLANFQSLLSSICLVFTNQFSGLNNFGVKSE